jgi:predicted nucleic acid-binding protein
MAKLVDSSLWIDLARTRSPRKLKAFIASQLDDPEICIAEPIAFEVLRHANDEEVRLLTRQFETVPMLSTPHGLSSKGVEIGRACRRKGFTVGSLDVLIAVIAIHHSAEIITFDDDFEQIVMVSSLVVTRLKRPAS